MYNNYITPTTLIHTQAFLNETAYSMESHYFFSKDISKDVFYFYCYIWQNNPGRVITKFWQLKDINYQHTEDIAEIFNQYCKFINSLVTVLDKYQIKPNQQYDNY